MSNIIFNTIAFLIELSKGLLLSEFLFEIECRKKIRIFIGSCIFTIIVGGISIYYSVYDFSFICVIVALITLFWNITNKKSIALLCLLYVGVSIVDMIIGSFVMMVFNINANTFLENNWMFLPVNSISLIFLIAILHYKKKIKTFNIYISKWCTILLISGGICLGIYISVLQIIGFNNAQSRQMKVATLMLSLISVIFIVIAALLIIKDNKNEQLVQEAAINAKLLKLQEEYYTMQLQKDEETKKIRHDIKNHFYCMQILAEDKNYTELNEYIKRIYNDITNYKSNISTGNKLVDAIVANLENKYANVKIIWEGQLPENMKLSAMDVCTIFSNLLSNAFEAANKSQDKRIDVSVKTLEAQLFVTIKNQCIKAPQIVKGKLVTTKSEKNHGYGVNNAKKSIEVNNGNLEIKVDNNIFIAEIIFYDMLY